MNETLILIRLLRMYIPRNWEFGSALAKLWRGSQRERDHWGDPDVDGRIILRLIFRKLEGVVGTG
jgi:hypothetical protein